MVVTKTQSSAALENASDARGGPVRVSVLVTAICWGMVVLEGYDLISFGSVLPVLTKTAGSGFNSSNAGVVGSAAFIGATVGALSAGWLGDRYGRRVVAIGSLVIFSIFTMLCGFAVGPVSLFILRLLAGIGIGAIVPATSALTLEYAVEKHRTLVYTLMLSGVPVGGVLAAISGLTVIPALGWRWVFFIGIVPAVIVLPFLIRGLPESIVFLSSTGRTAEAEALRAKYDLPVPQLAADDATSGEGEGIFSRRYLPATLLLGGASFCGLLTWFGLGTWLPGIMREQGYGLSSALTFALVLNLGAIAGSLVIARATDRFGSKVIVVPTFVVLALAMFALATKPPMALLLVFIVIAGVGGHGGQILVNRFVSRSYPPQHRARALGWSLGSGRPGTILGPIVIGYIVAGGRAPLGFVFFGFCALLGALLLAVVPRTPAMDAAER